MSRNKLFWITLCTFVCFIESGNGLQGVPTWMCLGIKSPFIEFKAEFELLSNESISLNVSDNNPDVRQRKNGLHNLGNFINPIANPNRDEKTFKGINNTTFSIQSDLLDAKDSRKQQEKHLYELQQQQIQELQNHNLNKSTTNKILMDIIKPIVTDSHHPSDDDDNSSHPDQPTIQIIANSHSDSHHEQMASHRNYPYDDSRDRKIIMPLALKTTLIERERPVPTPSPTLAKPQSNIDDLKNHLLMLQNYSDVDKNFQSKFVVFKKPTTPPPTTTTTSTTTVRSTTMPFPMTMYRTKPSINMPLQNSQILRDVSYPFSRVERVTVVPQVFLQNDQQQPDSDDDRAMEERRKNRRNEKKPKKERKRTNKNKENKNNNKLQNMIPPTSTAVPTKKAMRREQRRRNFDAQQQTPIRYEKSLNGSQVLIVGRRTTTTPNTPYIINLNDKQIGLNTNENARKLSRTIRSKAHNQRRQNQNKMQRDIIMPIESSSKNQTTEKIDLNPKNCYEVSGMSKGQQKICEQYTSIMPAISRGARAAIQECQHQFQNRRWNCSTVDDNTVFGPLSAIGTPEMAFVHALAAATTASFIARACRDGQLASCGCSRSARPSQLHEDWTWGGCGDDLEFGYKFSQNFIDIREKERKRGARGLVTVPTKTELLGNETSVDNTTVTTTSPEEQAKADDMLKLQQKITQELLNSNLKENERNELQEKINKEILNSKLFNANAEDHIGRKKNGRYKQSSVKARSLMNLHNNEAGRRAVIKKHRIICKCHGVSGSCSLVTCWQQLSTIREIGDFLREQYEQATQVKMNKRGRLQVKDARYKVPTAVDLVYLDDSPDWCRVNKQLQWPGTHGRKCNRTSTGLDSCSILCCGRGYNTKKIVIQERCNCKFQWCCNVRCDTCKKVIQEYTCK